MKSRFLLISIKKIMFTWLICIAIFSSITNVSAEMKTLNDSELSEVTGQAFSNYTLTENGNDSRIRIDLEMNIKTFTTVREFKLGYYPQYEQTGIDIGLIWPWWVYENGTGPGWSVDFEGLQLGENASNPLVLNGLTFRADFTTTAQGKRLDTFAIGSDHVTGFMRANNMDAFSGRLRTSLARIIPSWLDFDYWAYRTNCLNQLSISNSGFDFNDHGLYIVANRDKGIGLYAGFRINQF